MSNLEEVKQLIETSGNNFHCKVLNRFKEEDWSVLISPYYNDNVSGKPREIDLIAEKAFPVNSHTGYIGNINVKLFIECKYIPENQEIALWFHEKDINKAKELVIKTTRLSKTNAYVEKHHYLNKNNKVAKLFASGKKKNKDLKKTENIENEPIYKALNQSLNGMVYYRKHTSIIPSTSIDPQNTKLTLVYPIIVCNSFDTFYKVDIESIDINSVKEINEHFQLEVNYAYIDTAGKHKNEYFLIDVLNYEKIDSFLETIKEDVKATAAPSIGRIA